MRYYQQFRKAVCINKAAVSLNYQHIKMYSWTTKGSLADFLFSALFQGENWGVAFQRGALQTRSEPPNTPAGSTAEQGR